MTDNKLSNTGGNSKALGTVEVKAGKRKENFPTPPLVKKEQMQLCTVNYCFRDLVPLSRLWQTPVRVMSVYMRLS